MPANDLRELEQRVRNMVAADIRQGETLADAWRRAEERRSDMLRSCG
jgi:hypothetical protein